MWMVFTEYLHFLLKFSKLLIRQNGSSFDPFCFSEKMPLECMEMQHEFGLIHHRIEKQRHFENSPTVIECASSSKLSHLMHHWTNKLLNFAYEMAKIMMYSVDIHYTHREIPTTDVNTSWTSILMKIYLQKTSDVSLLCVLYIIAYTFALCINLNEVILICRISLFHSVHTGVCNEISLHSTMYREIL